MRRSSAQEKGPADRGQARQEGALSPFSLAVKAKKEEWYDKVKLTVRQMNAIIWIVSGLLAIVVILIILEAAGIFKLF